MVLLILAILAGAALSMVDYQVEEAKFDATTQALEAIDYAVLGPSNSRAADGTHAVSGFVADCGRLPLSLEELYIAPDPADVPAFDQVTPTGDSEVLVSGGWNGPYIQPTIGATSLTDGWAADLKLLTSNGEEALPDQPVSIVRSFGRDQEEDDPTDDDLEEYDKDRSLIFESEDESINRWQSDLTVLVKYGDSSTNPDLYKGNKIVVRVYGPTLDNSGVVNVGTVAQQTVDLPTLDFPNDLTSAPPITVTFADLPIGPRIIRAYQLINATTAPSVTDELSTLPNQQHPEVKLETVSVPTRVVHSRETASITLVLRDTEVDLARYKTAVELGEAISLSVLGSESSRAVDGTRVVSGFVADCGRLPLSLEELYIAPDPAYVPAFDQVTPLGDSEVSVSGGWNGPYLRPAIGTTIPPTGWDDDFTLSQSNTTQHTSGNSIGYLKTTYYGEDYYWIWQADGAISGATSQPENKWQKDLTVDVRYNDAFTDPDISKGDKIVIRVYGPVFNASTGKVTLGTIQQKIVPITGPFTETFEDISIGPRIIRVYQLLGSSTPADDDDLFTDPNLETVSVPTRLTVSHETSGIQLILKDK